MPEPTERATESIDTMRPREGTEDPSHGGEGIASHRLGDPPWALSSPLRAAASWIFVVTALVTVDAAWTYHALRKQAARDVQAVRSSGAAHILHEDRVYSQDEIIVILRERPNRGALPLAGLALLVFGAGITALRRPVTGALISLGLMLTAGALHLGLAREVSANGVGFFLFLSLLAALAVRGALGLRRIAGEHRASAAGSPI